MKKHDVKSKSVQWVTQVRSRSLSERVKKPARETRRRLPAPSPLTFPSFCFSLTGQQAQFEPRPALAASTGETVQPCS